MNLKRYRNRVNNILHNIDEEIAELMGVAEDAKKELEWVEHVATLKAGDKLYRKPCNTPSVKWKGRNITIAEVNSTDVLCGHGIAIKEQSDTWSEWRSATWYEPAKECALTFEVVANGAGRGVCACGNWHSRVSDDANVMYDDYISKDDIKEMFEQHVREVNNGQLG